MEPTNSAISSSQVFIPFKEFPTYELLHQAKQQYIAANKAQQKDVAALEKDGLPKLTPPRTKKCEIFLSENYQEIDDFVKKIPLSEANETIANLSSIIAQKCWNDLSYVRSIFVWISSLNVAMIDKFLAKAKLKKASPLCQMYIIFKTNNTEAYDLLFRDMCLFRKIPCKFVRCLVKGSGFRASSLDKLPETFMCAVHVAGSWRFVHQSWGSCAVSRLDDVEYVEMTETTGSEKANTVPRRKVLARCANFWFLTDPEEIIFSHMALQPEEQLLPRPITSAEFFQMPFRTKNFFQLGMTTSNCPTYFIDSNDGKVTIEFDLPKDRRLKFNFQLFKRYKDFAEAKYSSGGSKKIEGSLSQFTFMEVVEERRLSVKVNFPWIGKFKFLLNGLDLESSSHRMLTEHVIQCRQPAFSCASYPINNRCEWGPGAEVSSLGLKPITHEGGLIVAKEGRAEIKFRFTGDSCKDILFYHELESEKLDKKSLEDDIRYYISGNEAVVNLKVPEYGKYTLKLFAKNMLEECFENICNYLVEADRGCADTNKFPKAEGGRIGDLQTSSAQATTQLKAISHPCPLIELPADQEEEFNLKMSASELAELRSTLVGPDDVDYTSYLWQESADKSVDQQVIHSYSLRFLKAGLYDLAIKGKVEDCRAALEDIYKYVIKVVEPTRKIEPFPDITSRWDRTFRLISPTSQYLQKGREEHFLLEIKEMDRVVLKPWDVQLKKLESDMWTVTVKVDGESGDNVTLCVTEMNEAEEVELLAFKVTDDEYLKELNNQHLKAELEAKRLREEEEQRRIAEARMAEERRLQQEAEAKAREQDFIDNRKRYEEDERKLEEAFNQHSKKEQKQKEPQKMTPRQERVYMRKLLESGTIAVEETNPKVTLKRMTSIKGT